MAKGQMHLLFNGGCNDGKTVAWCCMYRRMEKGIGDFRLEYKEKEENPYKAMYSRMEQGRSLPYGTAGVRVDTSRFKRGDADICEVVVMDYNNSSIDHDGDDRETGSCPDLLRGDLKYLFFWRPDIIGRKR